ncbi:putative kinase [Clydaea vesicula]|uniref:Kinase n=1 Tax=Clydaea vesicula TaxID=447962 RepID=A0AAD5U4Z8_9FUNG|nr:putative kinase [Clydaea vesicula]
MEEIADKLFLKSKKLVRLYVGLSGIPGSGKTTFAKKLATYIHETYNVKTIHISMDGFHLPKEELKRFSVFFDHKIGDPVFGDIEVSFDTRILIFEGLYLSFNENVWRDIYNEMDESFFLECTLELARKRWFKNL